MAEDDGEGDGEGAGGCGRVETPRWDRTIDPEIVPLFLSLQWARSRFIREMRPLLARHGLSAAEFDVLATLRNAPVPHRMTPSRIQEEVVITSGGLTKVMLQLEAQGMVERLRPDGDQRVKPVGLTAHGKATVERAMCDIVHASGVWVREVLSAPDIAVLTRLLGKLAGASGASGMPCRGRGTGGAEDGG